AELELVGDDRQVGHAPLLEALVVVLGVDQLEQVADREGDHVFVRLEVRVARLLEWAWQRLGEVAGDRRLLGDDECLVLAHASQGSERLKSLIGPCLAAPALVSLYMLGPPWPATHRDRSRQKRGTCRQKGDGIALARRGPGGAILRAWFRPSTSSRESSATPSSKCRSACAHTAGSTSRAKADSSFPRTTSRTSTPGRSASRSGRNASCASWRRWSSFARRCGRS